MLSLLFSFSLLIPFLNAQLSSQCQRPGYTFIGDLCYNIVNQKLSYQDAQNYCRGANANLAVLHTTSQANFLASSVRTQTGAPEGIFWIGLSRATTGSRFTWDDGTTMFWSNFDSTFPRDNLFVAESTVNGKWRTLDGTRSLFFVCSFDPNNVNPVTSQPSTLPSSTQSFSSTSGYSTQYPSSSSASPTSTKWPDSTTYQTSSPSPPTTDYPSSSSTYQQSTQTDSSSTAYPSTVTPGDSTVSSTNYPSTITP